MSRIKIAVLAGGLMASGCLMAMDESAKMQIKINKTVQYINNYFTKLPDVSARYKAEYDTLMQNELFPKERLGRLKEFLDGIEFFISQDVNAAEDVDLGQSPEAQDQKPTQDSVQVPYPTIKIVGGVVVIVALGYGIYAYFKKTENKTQVTRDPELNEAVDTTTL